MVRSFPSQGAGKLSRIKLLVCGGTGFIGRNVVEYFSALPDDFEVHATRHTRPEYACDNVQWHKVDLTKSDQVDRLLRTGFHVVVQAAATTSGANDIVNRPYIHVPDNAIMNSLLFKGAFDHKVGHVVFFSCSIMYQPSNLPVREDQFDANSKIFQKYHGMGWTKVYIEKMGEFYSSLGQTKFSMLRHSNIFGPHDKFDLERSHVFGATVTKIMTTCSGNIEIWGDGTEARDLLYVDDLVRSVHLCIDKQDNRYELFNVGSGQAFSVREIAEKIIQCANRNISLSFDLNKPTLPFTLALDYSRIRSELGWSPGTSLEDGIQKTLDWYRAHYKTAS